MASFGGHSGVASNKITKQRAKLQVKPILKKLAHSEKNSLDLDRGWEEQAIEQMEQGHHHAWGGNYGSRSSSTKDVSFAVSSQFGGAAGIDGHGVGSGAGATAGSGSIVGGNVRGKFTHGRSASQASTGSASRGTFVHPFQQTPRTSTPPLSYANSLASFDNARDYSPTITENDDDEVAQALSQPHHSHIHHPPPTLSQSNLRRPSLASQRTASFTDITAPSGPLRVNTGRSTPAPASRLALGSLITAASQSDLQLNLSLSGGDSPINPGPLSLGSPASSIAPMSPLRSSLEAAGFPRLRSRSELDTAARAENIRAARRKFEERERAKEEKYDREMIRKRERRDNKQAKSIEKESARKASMSDERSNTLSGLSTSQRPAASRKSTPTNLSTTSAPAAIPSGGGGGLSFGKGFWAGNSSRDALQDDAVGEKSSLGFASRKYESVPDDLSVPPAFGPAPPAGAGDVRFEQARPRRSSNAKRRTQTYWQGFVLWLRTKILRLSGK